MPLFLLTATDEKGKRETHRVEAENSQDAYHDLESRGFTQIVLHTEDAGATASAMFPPDPNVEEHVSAADMVRFQYQTSFGFFLYMLKDLYWKFRWGAFLAIIVLVIKWNNQTAFSTLELAMFGLFLIPLILALWVAYFSSSRKYTLLMQAFSWGRWQEVIDRVPPLRGKIADFELSGREAVALTALGRFDEGLAMMEPFADSPDVPRWMYLGRLSELYEIIKDEDQVIECLRLSYEDAPENPTVQIDYAYGLMKYNRDNSLAEQLLDDAEQQHLGELVELLFFYFKGLLELNRGNFKAAEASFKTCQSGLLPIAPSQPLLQLFVDLNRAYLAIALAEQGELQQAEELFRLALPRLKALDSTCIMDRYAAVLAR
ncbi:hypothetical protein [uncultured Gimesia sp.]|uniref:hypothetical protein n=1 Tax=uncultured Gimesia sp. TaxID=1678688 RepID=UPI0030DD6945|tara:strand:- start:50490 stop:51611 length:1122 start_codon:yes stop_codon:yes gene_type:complete